MGIYIQYGCGLSCPKGWLNFDVSPRLRFERLPFIGQLMSLSGRALFPSGVRYGDVVKGLPLAPSIADGVYCSHVLEHMDRSSVEVALSNTFSMLKPGGVFRLVVPDLYWRAVELVKAVERGEKGAADLFMRASYLGQERPIRGFEGYARAILGNADHRWMYDEHTMTCLLSEAGFTEIRRCKFGDSKDPMFAKVEDRGRFIDSGHNELAMEAQRPR